MHSLHCCMSLHQCRG